MKVVWSVRAKKSLKDIADYIAKDNRKLALEFASKIYNKSKLLSEFSEVGREGKVFNTRELVAHKNYVIVYRVKSKSIEILYVYHSARDWH